MSFLDVAHGRLVFGRRVRVLSDRLARLMPQGASVLDVGCGDGTIARLIGDRRPDLTLAGIDVLIRPRTAIPVLLFDGKTIPHPDDAFDVVMFVDVLHHADDPLPLLKEAARVARKAVVLKDHLCEGPFARETLRLMDWVGNARHGVALPYNYWSRTRWEDAFRSAHLTVQQWEGALALYPPPASWLFDRSLHFIASARPDG